MAEAKIILNVNIPYKRSILENSYHLDCNG